MREDGGPPQLRLFSSIALRCAEADAKCAGGDDCSETDLFHTPFLAFLLSSLYESFNLRDARRRLADVLLAHSFQPSFQTARLLFCSLPCRRELQLLAIRALTGLIDAKVQRMRRLLQLYCGQGIRHDGNFKLAARLSSGSVTINCKRHKTGCPYSVVLGFTGTDGALLMPLMPAAGESWERVREVLVPYLEELKNTRMSAGMSLLNSMPVFHATDSYQRQYKKIPLDYKDIWKGLLLTTESATPRADAVAAKVATWDKSLFRVCGDPEHDIIAFRRCLPTNANDFREASLDHADMLHLCQLLCVVGQMNLGLSPRLVPIWPGYRLNF